MRDAIWGILKIWWIVGRIAGSFCSSFAIKSEVAPVKLEGRGEYLPWMIFCAS